MRFRVFLLCIRTASERPYKKHAKILKGIWYTFEMIHKWNMHEFSTFRDNQASQKNHSLSNQHNRFLQEDFAKTFESSLERNCKDHIIGMQSSNQWSWCNYYIPRSHEMSIKQFFPRSTNNRALFAANLLSPIYLIPRLRFQPTTNI